MHAIIFKCFWHLNLVAVWMWHLVAVHQFALWWCLVCTSGSPGAQGKTIRSPLKLIDGGDHRKSWGTSVFDCCAVICALLLCCQPFQVAAICASYKTEQMGVSHLLAKCSALTWLNKLKWSTVYLKLRLLQGHTTTTITADILCIQQYEIQGFIDKGVGYKGYRKWSLKS